MTNRYLIIAPAWVGDMIMAQALFVALKQQHSDCVIDVVAPKSTAALLKFMPQVHDVISLSLGHGDFEFKARQQIGLSLRNKGYTQAIVMTNSWKSALIPWFAKIPKRTGWRGELRYHLLNDIRILEKTKYPLMVEQFIALTYPANTILPKPLPKPVLSVSTEAKLQVMAKFNLDLEKPVLALCPGAEYGPAKQWPAQYYAEVARAKHAEGWTVWIFGSPKDKAVAEEIQKLSGDICVNLAGQTNLAEAVDLIACADTVVTNDSGLMHIASSLDRNVIAIYGSSSSKFTPPLSDHARILSLNLSCSPCFKRECPLGHLNCLKQLLPDQVLKSFEH